MQILEHINKDFNTAVEDLKIYKSNLDKGEKLDNKYENELIKNIHFLGILENELKLKFKTITDKNAETKHLLEHCVFWINRGYYNNNDVLKLINMHNFEQRKNADELEKVICKDFKSRNEQQEYEDWKENYFDNIEVSNKKWDNQINKTLEMDDLIKFQDEVNSMDSQNHPSTSQDGATCSIL